MFRFVFPFVHRLDYGYVTHGANVDVRMPTERTVRVDFWSAAQSPLIALLSAFAAFRAGAIVVPI